MTYKIGEIVFAGLLSLLIFKVYENHSEQKQTTTLNESMTEGQYTIRLYEAGNRDTLVDVIETNNPYGPRVYGRNILSHQRSNEIKMERMSEDNPMTYYACSDVLAKYQNKLLDIKQQRKMWPGRAITKTNEK